MARNISDIYEFIRYIVRKQRGVFVSTQQVCDNLDTAQMDAFNEYFSGYGANQNIHDALRPFRVYQPFTSDSAGFVAFQSDYIHLLGSPFTVSGSTVNEVAFVNEDEFVPALKSQLRAVSTSRPIAKDTSVGFSVYPQTVQQGFYTYLKRPDKPVYGFTQVGRSITYVHGTSTQLQWSDQYINNIIARSLKYVSINMEDQVVSQFSDQFNAESK